eukprot:gb/GECG01003473.1/.p1 GENE.gb/GECG01003473.1/~~gb/GECG01003473.1/.p1  ORF type:complete len:518 (+),score=59.58 gb/GECG01003473.1/:1-1554(+)
MSTETSPCKRQKTEAFGIPNNKYSTHTIKSVYNHTNNHTHSANKNGKDTDMEEVPLKERFESVRSLLKNRTSFGNETGSLPMAPFEAGEKGWENVRRARVLVIGAGGLGCEMLKDLALSGFHDIHVIDLDSIDLTNLNRQFLFRMKDVGKPKAEVAARFVEKRVPDVSVKAHVGKIQDKGTEWYRQFDIIISGLDNIEARRWINAALCSFVETDEEGDIAGPEGMHNRILNPQRESEKDDNGEEIARNMFIPLIDGGTEGFKGQCRVIFPCATPCFECTIDMFPPQTTYAMCTIAETPRRPEHCIAYAMMVEWNKYFPTKKLDSDSPDDMNWIYEKALERAKSFGISGLTYMGTLGVVKNIIPAVASTNAMIAASCVNEAFKLITLASQSLNNYFLFVGDAQNGVFGNCETLDRKEAGACLACRQPRKTVQVSKVKTLGDIIEEDLRGDSQLQLKDPSIMKAGKALYSPRPPAAKEQTKPNLEKRIGELVEDGEVFVVTDAIFPAGVSLTLTFHLQD